MVGDGDVTATMKIVNCSARCDDVGGGESFSFACGSHRNPGDKVVSSAVAEALDYGCGNRSSGNVERSSR